MAVESAGRLPRPDSQVAAVPFLEQRLCINKTMSEERVDETQRPRYVWLRHRKHPMRRLPAAGK